jgi:Mg-chelatase subunit ChlD
MAFDFVYPWALLALMPAAALLLGIFFKYSGQHFRTNGRRLRGNGRRFDSKLATMILRLLAVVLLVLSLAGLEVKIPVNDAEILFVADLSDSTLSKQKEISDFIASSMRLLPDNYQAGIISFGENALVEQAVNDYRGFYSFHSMPNSNYSNLDAALQRAEGLFSPDSRKRIVLLTDGAENMGDSMLRASALLQRGIRVDGVYMDTVPPKEVQLSGLVLPSSLYQGESYDIRVEIDSTIEAQGTLRLFADRAPVGTQQVQIQKGRNIFLFRETAKDTGTIVYEAELELAASVDTFRQNNRMASFVRIDGPPVVALVEGQAGEGHEIAKIMEAGGLEYKLFTPHTLPNQLEELVKYDAVILSNAGYDDLGKDKVDLLNNYVKFMGKGLLVTGGDNSYALGGYLGTALEEMLPVDMDLSKKKDIPSLALVLVIDKSGSMSDNQYGISKMDLAKEAAIRSTEALRKTDFIGVVGFDSAASWVVETQPVKNREEIQDTIGTMQPGGGTNLYPGLSLAFQSLKDTNAALKHVIVLTDGHTQGGNFEGLVREMADMGITVSGVAVGKDSDVGLMERLAETGNGRYYFTDEFSSIPKIFTKETYMATRSYINNETFFPKALGSSPILSNIDAVPSLDGYITTTIKGGAVPVLVSNQDDDPVLAYWEYGLGKVAAWTSDAKGIWTENWMRWEDSPAFWLNTISSVLPGDANESGRIEASRLGNQGQVTISLDELDEGYDTSAYIVNPDGTEGKIKMQPSRPGYYQGNFPLGETGVYLIRVEQQGEDTDGEGGGTVSMTTGLVYPYSPEYDIRNPSSRNLLEHIVSQTKGRILEKPEDLLLDELPPVWKHHEIWPALMVAALMLFFLDIVLRKLGWKFIAEKWLIPVKEQVASKWNRLAAGRQQRFLEKGEAVELKAQSTKQAAHNIENRDSMQQLEKTANEAESKAADKVTETAVAKLKEKQEASEQKDFTSALLEARKKNKIRK